MAITTADRYFGEGIGGYGEADPGNAFTMQRRFIRTKRLDDVLGEKASLTPNEIAAKFETIAAAITKADDQVFADNAEFCLQHNISR